MEEAQQGSNGTDSQTTVIPTSQFPQIAQQVKSPVHEIQSYKDFSSLLMSKLLEK